MFVVGAGKKAPAIEGAVPAGGTIAAAYCFERKCRHIPLEWQRADAVVDPSNAIISGALHA
jgi:hypothetical protein